MGDDLADLLFRDAVADGAAEVGRQLLGPVGGNQRGQCDQAAVALRQPGTLPQVSIYDIIVYCTKAGTNG